MPEILRVVRLLTSCVWTQRTRILVLVLMMTMVVPQPAKGQLIDVAAIVSAIGAINTAITNVIGAGLRDIACRVAGVGALPIRMSISPRTVAASASSDCFMRAKSSSLNFPARCSKRKSRRLS